MKYTRLESLANIARTAKPGDSFAIALSDVEQRLISETLAARGLRLFQGSQALIVTTATKA